MISNPRLAIFHTRYWESFKLIGFIKSIDTHLPNLNFVRVGGGLAWLLLANKGYLWEVC